MDFPPPDVHIDSHQELVKYLESKLFVRVGPEVSPDASDPSIESRAAPMTDIDSFNTDVARIPVPADFLVFDSPVINPNTMTMEYTSNDPGRSVTIRSTANWNNGQSKSHNFHNRFHLFHKFGSENLKHCFTFDPDYFQFHSEMSKTQLEVKLGELKWMNELVPFYKSRAVRDFSKWDISLGAIGIENQDNWKGTIWRFWSENSKIKEQFTTTAIWRRWGLFFAYRYEMSFMKILECRGAHVAVGYEDSPIKFAFRAKNDKVMKWWEWIPQDCRAQLGYKFGNGSFLGMEAAVDTSLMDWDVGIAGKARLVGNTWYLGGLSTKGTGWLGLHTFLGNDVNLLVAANVETGRRTERGGLLQPMTSFEVRLSMGLPHT
jgi:hypothetical protein